MSSRLSWIWVIGTNWKPGTCLSWGAPMYCIGKSLHITQVRRNQDFIVKRSCRTCRCLSGGDTCPAAIEDLELE